MIGRSLASYRILEKLGEGAMGRVYLARDRKLERTVALKILPARVAADPRRLERFRREVKAVAAISHPGIVAIYSVGEADGLHFFAMEHVEGRSLTECIPERGFSLDELSRIALPVTEALVAAHAAGVVHRDLKPDNVMITDSGGVKVLDFGLAKRVSSGPVRTDRMLTEVGALVGTVTYMAPEQIRGGEVDERSDLFALGVMFYEMACGHHPFDTRDMARAMMSILHDRPKPVSAAKPSLGGGLDSILARCLEKEPEHRYPSAAALRAALEDLVRLGSNRTLALPIGGADKRERRSGSRPDVWSLPMPRDGNFGGRAEEIEELHRRLAAARRGVPVVAVVGLGGVGKTQLTVEFAYRFAGEYETVWWLPAAEPATLQGHYAALGRELGLKPRQDVERTVDDVRDWLGRRSGWLLLFDDAEEPAAVRPYLPSESSGHVVVTSRNPAWRGLGKVLQLSVWTAEQTARFLERRTGDDDAEAARRLNDAVGGLPLALEQAAAYVETSGQSLTTYVRLFGEQRRRLLSQQDRDAAASSESPTSVMATWDLSFQRIAESSPAAEQLLKLCAFMAPDDLPLDVLSGAGDLLPEPLRGSVADGLALDETVAALLRYSLVSRAGDSLSIHRLVQVAIRRTLAEEAATWAETALRAISKAFPTESYQDVRVWPRCSRLLPHALSCLRRVGETAPRAEAQLLDAVGSYLNGRAQNRKARPYLERALRIEEATHGRDHPQVAIRLNDLGRLWMGLGDLWQAHALFERALAIEEKALGPEHPNVARRLNNIAAVLNDLDRPAEARRLLRRALEIDEATRGSDDPHIAHRLTNLGIAYSLSARGAPADQRLRHFEYARALLERALRIYESALGPEHLLVGKTAMNMGSLLLDAGELVEAKRWLVRAIEVEERVVGPDHPEVAMSLKNLGEAHRLSGEIVEARTCYDRALAIETEAFGRRHRELGLTLEQLGILASVEENAEEARLCFERALDALEATVGSEHRDTVRVRGRLQELAGQPDGPAR